MRPIMIILFFHAREGGRQRGAGVSKKLNPIEKWLRNCKRKSHEIDAPHT